MATCGYVCPVCEGKGFLEDTLEDCEFCSKSPTLPAKTVKISTNEWIKTVHESSCCSDIGNRPSTQSISENHQ